MAEEEGAYQQESHLSLRLYDARLSALLLVIDANAAAAAAPEERVLTMPQQQVGLSRGTLGCVSRCRVL